jgi:hypothetical protein
LGVGEAETTDERRDDGSSQYRIGGEKIEETVAYEQEDLPVQLCSHGGRTWLCGEQ